MKKIFQITDKVVDLSKLNLKDEFIVEAMNHNKLFAVAGKVIANRNILGDNDLETIWDLANWGVSHPSEITIKGGVYDGCKAFVSRDMDFIYIPLRKDISVVNDNVMIRKHYDIETGYYLWSDRKENRDEWRYATRNEILSEMRANPYI